MLGCSLRWIEPIAGILFELFHGVALNCSEWRRRCLAGKVLGNVLSVASGGAVQDIQCCHFVSRKGVLVTVPKEKSVNSRGTIRCRCRWCYEMQIDGRVQQQRNRNDERMSMKSCAQRAWRHVTDRKFNEACAVSKGCTFYESRSICTVGYPLVGSYEVLVATTFARASSC